MDKQKIVKLTWSGLKTLLKSPNFLINVIMIIMCISFMILCIVEEEWWEAGFSVFLFFYLLTELWRRLKNFKKKK